MGAGPIPWTAVDAYARRMELTDFEFFLLDVGIRILDSAFMEKVQSDREKGKGKRAVKKHGN